MKAITSTFKKLAKALQGRDRPKPRGIWTYDLERIAEASRAGDAREMVRLLDKYTVESLLAMTPLLHKAAANGHLELMKVLLDHKAPVDDRDGAGATPLHIAAAAGQKAAAELLIERGAAVDMQDATGMTPLMRACRGGQKGTADLLLQHGARLDMTDDAGQTPGTIALEGGHKSLTALIDNEIEDRAGHRLRRDITVRRIRLQKKRGPA